MLDLLEIVSVCVCSTKGVWLSKKHSGNYAGLFQTPGGKMERGESPLMAAQRELLEETGMGIPLGDLHPMGHFVRRARDTHIPFIAHTYIYVLPEGQKLRRMEPDKAGEWMFWTYQEVNLPLLRDKLLPGVEAEIGAAEFRLNYARR